MNPFISVEQELALGVQAAVEHAHHRFPRVIYEGHQWDLSHLDPYVFYRDSGMGVQFEIVVIFSCHCFTHAVKKDERSLIPPAELFQADGETRVLNPERYELSSTLLLPLIKALPERHIIVAAPGDNYVTFERKTAVGGIEYYGMFFTVTKARNRKNRLILRVQSAYLRQPSARQKQAKKVRFDTLLKAAFEGRKIMP